MSAVRGNDDRGRCVAQSLNLFHSGGVFRQVHRFVLNTFLIHPALGNPATLAVRRGENGDQLEAPLSFRRSSILPLKADDKLEVEAIT